VVGILPAYGNVSYSSVLLATVFITAFGQMDAFLMVICCAHCCKKYKDNGAAPIMALKPIAPPGISFSRSAGQQGASDTAPATLGRRSRSRSRSRSRDSAQDVVTAAAPAAAPPRHDFNIREHTHAGAQQRPWLLSEAEQAQAAEAPPPQWAVSVVNPFSR
jgi:hypothetical protein